MENLVSKIISHRGSSYNAPENSLAAINLAWNQGVQKVEVDVRLTKDKQIVVFHDESLMRLANLPLYMSKTEFKLLKKVDIGVWRGQQWAGEYIPLLSDVLALLSDEKQLVIEVKVDAEIIPYLKLVLGEFESQRRYVEFISFDYEVICELKKTFPDIKCLWLLDLDYNKETKKEMLPLDEILDKVKKGGVDGVDLWAGSVADKEFIKKLKEENIDIYTWTVNDLEIAQEYLDLGVDGITTDRPQWMLENLK